SQNGRDNAFRFIVRGSALAASSGDRVVLYGGAGVEADAMPALDCGTNGLCTQLNRYSADDEYLLLRAYQDATDSRLVLDAIPCHAEGLVSFRSCVTDDSDVNWPI